MTIKMRKKGEVERKFGGVSIPMGVLEEIDKLIKELRFWPSRGAFVREACLEKIRSTRQFLKERREMETPAKVKPVTE